MVLLSVLDQHLCTALCPRLCWAGMSRNNPFSWQYFRCGACSRGAHVCDVFFFSFVHVTVVAGAACWPATVERMADSTFSFPVSHTCPCSLSYRKPPRVRYSSCSRPRMQCLCSRCWTTSIAFNSLSGMQTALRVVPPCQLTSFCADVSCVLCDMQTYLAHRSVSQLFQHRDGPVGELQLL